MVDESGKARITDFGLAAIARNPHSQRSTLDEDGHTARWCVPEVLKSEPVSKESDVFSFGMIIVEVGGDRLVPCQPPDRLIKVFTGEAPFGGEKTPAVITKIMTGKIPRTANSPQIHGPPMGIDSAVFEPVPSDRPCMEEARRH
jgi:serine/threonine protein kinase